MAQTLEWLTEIIGRGTDRNVGTGMWQLTSAARISHNIYCEERYTSKDGKRLAFLRSPLGTGREELWVCDLPTDAVACLCDRVNGLAMSNIYSDNLYFIRPGEGDARVLMRVDMRTLELEEVFDLTPCPRFRWPVGTVSPDDRYFVSNCRLSEDVFGLYRADLQRGTWEIFHEHTDIFNPHPQFEPVTGRDILIQHNRGGITDARDNIVKGAGPEGVTLYAIDRDGGNKRELPVGPPHTHTVTGHECWVGDTGEVLLTTNDRAIYLARPGADKPTCLWRGFNFSHISVSQDGKYFVVDDLTNGRLYVGNIANRRMLPLCDTGASCGYPQYAHPHAYLMPGNRHVIFNSDATGLAQVWAADVPPEFLQALEEPAVVPSP